MNNHTDDWIILATTSPNTLKLTETLTEAGYDVWAPVETVTLRARRGHKREVIASPLMAGYVFARAHQLLDLLTLSRSPSMIYQVWDREKRKMVSKGHPYFRLFQPFGTLEIVRESQLANLRRLDGLRRPKGPLRQWKPGDRFRMTDGAYAGLSGSVVSTAKEMTVIAIDGWNLKPEVSTRLLHPEVDEPADPGVSCVPQRAMLARAA